MSMTLSDEVRLNFASLVSEYGAKVVKEKVYPELFGNSLVILESSNMRFRFSSDRGETGVQIAPISSPENWEDFEVALLAVEGTPYERVPPVLPRRSLSVLSDEVLKFYPQLNEAFSAQSWANTERAIAEVKATQAKKFAHLFNQGVSPFRKGT